MQHVASEENHNRRWSV